MLFDEKKISKFNGDIGVRIPAWISKIIKSSGNEKEPTVSDSELTRHLSNAVWHWSNGRNGHGQLVFLSCNHEN